MFKKFLMIAGGLLILFAPVSTLAQASKKQGQGLEISPPVKELKADPGESITTKIKVRNVTEKTLSVKAEVNDFVAGNETGQPKILLEEGERSPYSIKDWITTISEVTLKPKQQKSVTVSMDVPADASPGGHYGVIRFTGTPPGIDDTGVSLSASIGALVLVNISGDVSESASIAEMYTAQGEDRRWLFEYGPVNIVERIENTGNVHFKPSGNIRVTSMWGKEVANFQLNETGGNVLPSSIRKFDQTLENKFMFGRYKVQADVVYGSQNTIISDSITFWVIPYKIIALIILAIIILVFGIKKYNKYIVKKAHRSSGGRR